MSTVLTREEGNKKPEGYHVKSFDKPDRVIISNGLVYTVNYLGSIAPVVIKATRTVLNRFVTHCCGPGKGKLLTTSDVGLKGLKTDIVPHFEKLEFLSPMTSSQLDDYEKDNNKSIEFDSYCQGQHTGIVEKGILIIEEAKSTNEPNEPNLQHCKRNMIHEGECYQIMPGHRCWALEDQTVLYEFDTTESQSSSSSSSSSSDIDTTTEKSSSSLASSKVYHPSHSEGTDFDGVLARDVSFELKSFNKPDEIFEGINQMFIILINYFENVTIKKIIGKSGASWIKHIHPIENEHINCEHNHSCIQPHIGFVESGSLHVTMENGLELLIQSGECFAIEAGNNLEVISDNDLIMYEFAFK